MYPVVVVLAVVVHLAFLCYLIVGGFVALRLARHDLAARARGAVGNRDHHPTS
jgi:hypothetical protein